MAEMGFENRKVPVYTHYRDMLAAHSAETDFVIVPTPIECHAPMHRDCIDLELPCFLEKPPTLFWEELEEMIEVEARSKVDTFVGFSYLIEPQRLALKQRLVNGEFGKVVRATFNGWSPRDSVYYNRAPWVGRLMLGDYIVLDACLGNALAHFIHNLLFWCGQDQLFSWETITEIEAELYRSHRIENFDTAFARAVSTSGIEIRVAGTHCGVLQSCMRETIECEEATLHYASGDNVDYSIHWRDGRTETSSTPQINLLRENLREYMAFLHGDSSRPLTLMSETRPFVHFYNLMYVAAGQIHAIPQRHINWVKGTAPYGEWVTVEGLKPAMDGFCESGRFPSDGGAEWGQPGGRAKAGDLGRLEETARGMFDALEEA